MNKCQCIWTICFWICFSSCYSSAKLLYFNDSLENTFVSSAITEPIIQKDDLLSININSLNPEASIVFNAPNISASGIHSATAIGNVTPAGYLVDQEGMISFPILGKIKAAGMTKAELAASLTKELNENKLLVDPIVNIRFMNFRISVLGEVNRPGVYIIPNEKLSMLEALGLAGDVTIYGKKENIMIIREEENGLKQLHRLNLNTQKFLSSPYYYLRSNDIIYVEPSQNKIQRERNQFLFPIIISLISLGMIITNNIR